MIDRQFIELGNLASDKSGAISIGPFGSSMKSDTYTDRGIRVIRGTNISDTRAWKGDWVFISESFANRMPRCEVKPGDLVFPHRGSIGEVAIIPNDGQRYFLSSSLMKITLALELTDPLFVYYYFKSELGRREILRFGSQVGTPGIGQPLNSLRQFRLLYPSLHVQSTIASMLAVLDDKIELNRQMNKTLEAMARAIFKDWFVDFGPTRAKLSGIASYLAPDIWSFFPDRLDNEGKPERWEIVPLAALIEVNPPEQLARGRPAPYLDMASIPTEGPNPEPYIIRECGSGMRFRNGDTLFARITPCLENGKTAFVQNLPSGEVGWGSTEFIVLRSRPPVPPAVSYLIARDPVFRANAIRNMTGTSGRQRVNNDAISTFPVVLPDSQVLWSKLDDLVTPLFDRIAANDLESRTLAATRDLLLPKLMSGEIRVKDAEKIVGQAT